MREWVSQEFAKCDDVVIPAAWTAAFVIARVLLPLLPLLLPLGLGFRVRVRLIMWLLNIQFLKASLRCRRYVTKDPESPPPIPQWEYLILGGGGFL